MKVAVLDLGMGNLLSIRRGLERAGAEVVVAQSNGEAACADALVLPGVGAFRDGIRALRERFGEATDAACQGKIPILGICLGMQLLFTRSYEGGEHHGLGVIRGDVVKLPPTVKVPHMGWNSIKVLREGELTRGIGDGEYFYFVHSYYCLPAEGSVTIAATEYGSTFPAVVEKGAVFGTQFHPEKSGSAGGAVIRNFLEAVKR
ncbi:MAG: imidazole glycerol phosphate synthase subunit HisH [Candidatus Verstraetearchaeota archaeon]|nr:imidazole glycerol phosphate synthase subunit HisH [Candidatus Verstraetearchaeota archaeon]